MSVSQNAAAARPALPHGAPFQLLDRVVFADVETGYLRAVRRLSAGDALWPAEQATNGLSHPAQTAPTHFPDSLVIESLCQAAASLNALTASTATPSHRGYLVSISEFRFAAPEARARIGETLILEVQRSERLGSVIAFSARALATDATDATDATVAEAAARPGPGSRQGAECAEFSREVASGRLLFAVSFA